MKFLYLAALLGLSGCVSHEAHQSPVLPDSYYDRGRIIVEIANSDHWALKNGELMRAAMTDTGDRWVVINASYNQERFDGILKHELAHLIAWERYGPDIEEHGPEFRKVCRELITFEPEYFCKMRHK